MKSYGGGGGDSLGFVKARSAKAQTLTIWARTQVTQYDGVDVLLLLLSS
jgi:hypothetical protein